MMHPISAPRCLSDKAAHGPATTELQASIDCLTSLLTVLHSLTSTAYKQPLPLCFDSTIGAHTRHILDHYNCLLEGIHDQSIDYENRHRNSQLEHCPKVASALLAAICDKLLMLADLRHTDPPTAVLNAISVEEADSKAVAPTFSTLRRELRFLHSHTVHHLAIIRIMMGMLGLQVDNHTGLSPATLQHRQTS
ncbi:MAG: hypothetical protein ACI8PP_000456 [Candidatus Pseudothioglobus sp.]|jgi:hypothetical protein